jgi:hypothetical protein
MNPSGGVVGVGDPELDSVVRSQTGVRGYLELQDRINKQQRDNFDQLIGPSDAQMDLVFANVLEAGKFATATEVKIRENQRLTALGRGTPGQEFSDTAQQFNNQAINSARKALGILRGQRQRFVSELQQVVDQEQFTGALGDSREALVQNLSKFNLSPDDFGEVISIWDEATNAASQGAEQLHGFVERNLDDFIAQRGRPDRGNHPHSPLAWWKYVLIVAYIGGTVFGVAACFLWSACTWVWPAISATAPWIFQIIDRGC